MNQSLKKKLQNLKDMGISEIPVRRKQKPQAVAFPVKIQSVKNTAGESLTDIRSDIGDCTRCQLSKTRTNIVFGVGDPKAQLMFIGEAPGHDEDLKGEPFVGRAGQLLTKMIEAMGLKREQVYIANIIKCRPPENRYPEPEESATCSPFLIRQIHAIRPKVIVALGNLATQSLLKTKTGIMTLHGTFREFEGSQLMPTFHPAFLLRNPPMKKEAWEDLKKVMAFLKIG